MKACRLVDTLAHELAHLKHPDHNAAHRRFAAEIQDDMILEGIEAEISAKRFRIDTTEDQW